MTRTSLRGDRGDTLVEILVALSVLSIGITDKGQSSACDTDKKTVETAEEAYFAQPTAQGGGDGKYAAETDLKPKFIHEESKWYNISLGANNKSFTVVKDSSLSGNPCT